MADEVTSILEKPCHFLSARFWSQESLKHIVRKVGDTMSKEAHDSDGIRYVQRDPGLGSTEAPLVSWHSEAAKIGANQRVLSISFSMLVSLVNKTNKTCKVSPSSSQRAHETSWKVAILLLIAFHRFYRSMEHF